MSTLGISLDEILETRTRLINEINKTITVEEKNFLLGFKSLKPDWALLGLENFDAKSKLSSVRWKLLNLQKLGDKKNREAIIKLKEILEVNLAKLSY